MEGVDVTLLERIIAFGANYLMPFMTTFFILGTFLRLLIYYTVKREDWFSREFEKRIKNFLDHDSHQNKHSFFVLTKKLLERTFYELFEARAILKRRKHDTVMSLTDRLFMISHGAGWLVRDTLKQIKYLSYGHSPPKFLEISKTIFQNNPCFNRVFGVIPSTIFNDVLNILPGMFVIGGIFGTFLGIMEALPQLHGMDLTNPDSTKQVMDVFLSKIAFSMNTSLVGIIFSVSMTLFNTFLSPESLFVNIVERYENCLDILWNRCENNVLPNEIADFDEHRDPLEALAADALNKELHNSKFDKRDYYEPSKTSKLIKPLNQAIVSPDEDTDKKAS